MATRKLHVRQTKTDAGDRIITIDAGTAAVLTNWQGRQLLESAEWDDGWQDSGRVFTKEDGTPLRNELSEHLEVLIGKAGLPPVRFHDLRHGAASMLVAAGQGRVGDPRPLEGKLHARRLHNGCRRAVRGSSHRDRRVHPTASHQ
ncbi:MAG: hypothetical protein ACRDOK_25155 [Streptosporangiaceae bacterium]